MSKNLKVDLLLTEDELVANVTSMFDAAVENDPSAIVRGSTWYPTARNTCVEIASATGLNVECVIGIMAVTSIASGWELNESAPLAVINYVRANGIHPTDVDTLAASKPSWFAGNKHSWLAAVRYATGELFELNGIKTRNFAANISGRTDNVTIDRHAMRIAMGGGMFETCATGTYNKLAAAYQIAASLRNIDPRTMQAVTWVYYRRVTTTRGGRTIAEVYGD